MSRVVLDVRHRASCMGDGPDELYHLCWTGCAQGDGLGGACLDRPWRRDPPAWRFREPPRGSEQAGEAVEQRGPPPQLLLRGWPLRVRAAPLADRLWA